MALVRVERRVRAVRKAGPNRVHLAGVGGAPLVVGTHAYKGDELAHCA